MRRTSLSSPSQVPCQSSPSTQVTPVTKRLRLDGAQDRAGLGIDLMDLALAILPDPERALGPGQPGVAAAAGAGIVASTAPVVGSIFWMRSSAIWNRCRPSNAVPACAATSIERTILPLAGSSALSLSPEANQTCWPSKVTPVHVVDARETGPYSRTISAADVDRFMRVNPSSPGSGAGSNKVVVNPGTGGVIQRRARPRPNDCTLPAAASASSARCTVRWLAPSASASAELDHDSPSARKASTVAVLLLDRPRQHDDLARAARRQREAALRRAHAGQRREHPRAAGRSRRAAARDAIRRRASRRTRAPAARRAARRRATPRRARGRARTAPAASRASTTVAASRTTWRHASTTSASEASSASTSSSSSGRSLAARDQPRRRRVEDARTRFRPPPSEPGCAASRAARSARASAARAACVRSRRIAMPATTSSWAARSAGGSGAGSSARRAPARPRRGARSAAGAAPRDGARARR